jgi:hypothetical protein
MFALSIAEASPAAIIVYTLRPKPNSALILIKFPASHDGGPDGSSRYGRRHGRGWSRKTGHWRVLMLSRPALRVAVNAW